MNDTHGTATLTQEPARTPELLEPDPGSAPLAPRQVAGGTASAATRRAPGAELAPQAGVVLQTSESVSKIFGALAKAQGQFATVERTMTAKITANSEDKRSFTYRYETLADVLDIIRKPMSDNGIAVMQFPSRKGTELLMRTLLAHESGEWISSDTTFVLAGTSPQAIGGGIAYARRYTLKSILGLAADEIEDDDGAAAEREHDQRDQRQEPPRPARRASERAASTGAIKAVEPSEVGGVKVWTVVLDTGFRCGTRDAELADAAGKMIGQRRKLVTKASSDPSRFMPVLTEIVPAES